MAIILLSGERGAGKTSALQALAAACVRAGLRPGGTLQPGVFGPDGTKLGSSWVDLATGLGGDLGSAVRDLGGPAWKRWSFSKRGLRAANEAVIAALEAGLSPVLVDELGPLELRLGLGLAPALAALLRAAPRFAEPEPRFQAPEPRDRPEDFFSPFLLIAVREELADELARLFPGCRRVRIEKEGRDAALSALRRALGLGAD